MPVHGITPMLLELGKVKIGEKGKEVTSKEGTKFKLPVKLDHFKIVGSDRGEDDNLLVDEQILRILKEGGKAKYNQAGELVGIPIRLLYNSLDANFPTYYGSFVNGKMSCSGDGKTAKTRDGRSTKCPCNRLDNKYQGKDKCKVNGKLQFLIEDTSLGGCYTFRTTSRNSVQCILSSMSLIKSATGGQLSFLPLQLIIKPKRTMIPTTGEYVVIHVVTVEYQGSIEELQKRTLAMGQQRTVLIENLKNIEAEVVNMSSTMTEQEEQDISEEFYPDSIELAPENIETKKEAKPTDEKSKDTKKATDAKTTGGKAVKSQDAKEPEKEEDSLLGQAIPIMAEKPAPNIVKITRDQLKTILNLKANVLQINDQKVWAKTIKDMKFPGVGKANNMTAKQGDLFIENLKALSDIPF